MEHAIKTIELVTRPTASTQFYLFNLFGNHLRNGRIWTNDLLYLLGLLGVSERAARTTLSRMKQQGWFETYRTGRQSQYVLTKQGQIILTEGDKRIFEEPLMGWDGCWYLVVYSLPEEKRKLRNEFRKKLIWFGFGNLAPGTWVSPHNRQPELVSVAATLEIKNYITLFTANTNVDMGIIQKCWDIAGLEADYHLFLSRHQADYEMYRTRQITLTPEECFVHHFWLTYNFQRFPLKDPNLPIELLPENWVGHQARQLFTDYRRLLAEGLSGFVNNVMIRK